MSGKSDIVGSRCAAAAEIGRVCSELILVKIFFQLILGIGRLSKRNRDIDSIVRRRFQVAECLIDNLSVNRTFGLARVYANLSVNLFIIRIFGVRCQPRIKLIGIQRLWLYTLGFEFNRTRAKIFSTASIAISRFTLRPLTGPMTVTESVFILKV